MSYKSDFENATGWNVVDTNINLDNANGLGALYGADGSRVRPPG